MLKNLKKTMSLVLSLTIMLCCFSFMGTVNAEESTTSTDWLATAEIAVGLRANRLTASLDYDETEAFYKLNYTGTQSPKNFMFVTNAFGDSDRGYTVSVDYKTATTSGESVGFVIGAKNNFGIVNGNDSVCDGLMGANIFKTVFEPYRVSGDNSKYIRISSNNATDGKAYSYSGSTTNYGTWANAAELKDGWNTISVYVSNTQIKQYVNGTLIATVSDIAVNSGYVGLYSGLKDIQFKNFTITHNGTDALDSAELAFALRANSSNTTFDYDETAGGYQIVSTATNPKNMMYVTNEYIDIDVAHIVSVDYKVATETDAENIGFVIGANGKNQAGVTGATVYKTQYQPYRVSGSNSTYIRISSNNATSGNAYDYSGSTTNYGTWANASEIKEGWNTISVYVSKTQIKHYINGILIATVSNIDVNSGYIGLFSAANNATFKNLTVTEVSALDSAELAVSVGATTSNTTFEYDETVGGHHILSTVDLPKNMMFVTGNYLNADESYTVSVDYKVDTQTADESVGFIIGATGANKEGLTGSTVYKTQFQPYRVSGDNSKYIRISSNDSSTGNPYDYTNSTTNKGSWANSAVINDDWNTISIDVSKTQLKYYVNGTLALTVSDITVDSGYVGLFASRKNAIFKNFTITKDTSIDMSEFVLSNSLRGTSENTALVYDSKNNAYVWNTTASAPKHNYLMSEDYNLTAGEEYTVSFEFKGTKTDVVPQTGIVFGADSVEGIIGTDADGNAITTCEGLASAYRNWIYFDTATNWNCNTFRMVSCDGTTTDAESNTVWDITKTNGTVGSGRVAYYGYKANDWNKIAVKVTNIGAYYYINDRFVKFVDGAANAGGYVGIYSLEANAMYRNFVVTEGDVAIESGKTVIACVGDSITQGVKATVAHDAYPFQLQERFGDDYEVLNFGKSGHTAVKGYTNSYMYTQEYADSLESNADIVVIMLGTNDANLCWSTLGTAFYETDLKEMIETYKAMPSNPQIYLCTTPYSLKAELNTTILNELVPIQQSLASEYGCELISMYAFLEGKDTLFADELHPNSNGYSVFADKFYNAITDSVYGDLNDDNNRDVLDLVRMKKVVAGLDVKYIRANADIDFDGSVSATDLTTFRKHLLGDYEIGGNEVEDTVAQLADEMSSIG